MQRKYVRKSGSRRYKDYSEEVLLQAVQDCKHDSLQSVSERYKIPLRTLWNKVKGLHKNSCGGKTVLSPEEDDIVQHLLTCTDFGMP